MVVLLRRRGGESLVRLWEGVVVEVELMAVDGDALLVLLLLCQFVL